MPLGERAARESSSEVVEGWVGSQSDWVTGKGRGRVETLGLLSAVVEEDGAWMMNAVLVLAPSLEVEGKEEAAEEEGGVKTGFSVAMMVEELGLEVREATGKEREKDSVLCERKEREDKRSAKAPTLLLGRRASTAAG